MRYREADDIGYSPITLTVIELTDCLLSCSQNVIIYTKLLGFEGAIEINNIFIGTSHRVN